MEESDFEKNVNYDVVLGSSFFEEKDEENEKSHIYIKYSYKPQSVDQMTDGDLQFLENDRAILSFVNNDKKTKQKYRFEGNYNSPHLDLFLIFDEEQNRFVLEKITSQMPAMMYKGNEVLEDNETNEQESKNESIEQEKLEEENEEDNVEEDLEEDEEDDDDDDDDDDENIFDEPLDDNDFDDKNEEIFDSGSQSSGSSDTDFGDNFSNSDFDENSQEGEL
ncbi:ell-associated factor eaf [Anaeramoeba flamelloides]|uniref:Ell-associated factor eaf n=1 Tax=Anaeramoeba flamelloides TaxID=1746091 RepID=A0AAV7Y8K2_9EUKA|nr:ell-associated factor eaf [Anaeramoeba flamelloides]